MNTILENRFILDLDYILSNFNYLQAYKLSQEIHEAEGAGYQISKAEDRLWEVLTDKIQRYEDKLMEEG